MHTSLQYKLRSGKNSKAAYYIKAGLRDALPDAWFRSRLEAELSQCRKLYDEEYIQSRVDYYCKFNGKRSLGVQSSPIGDLALKGNPSAYYFDSREILQWFTPTLRWNYLFGDQLEHPDSPTIVKSRPLDGDNSNNVLLKLNKCRHFVFLTDRIPICRKADRAIFRGHIGSRQNRARFCQLYEGNPRVDAADTQPSASENSKHAPQSKPMLSFYEHLHYRYIVALEGNDVASNLKWIMSSNSAAVMPRPTCETWFMEGRLQPEVHYIEIAPDFSDLIAKLDYYSAHLDQLARIVANANAYVAQFRDLRRERYIGLRVMQKYFNLTATA